MEELKFIEELGKESLLLFKQLINNSPIGSLILNEVKEVVYINNKLLGYFDGNKNEAYKHLNSMFRYESTDIKKPFCLTYYDGMNYKFSTSIKEVYIKKEVIDNIHIKNTWTVNEIAISKWFDISLVPFVCADIQYVWVTMFDMTNLMKYKVEADSLHILDDEANAIEKNRFHENVMECISNNCQRDGQSLFILIESKDTEWIQENFGFLWKNEHLSSFYAFLLSSLGPKDYACRYSENQFLVFLPCVELEDAKNFINQLDLYNAKHFNVKEVLSYKIIKLKIVKDITKQLVDEDQLYIKYFKVLSLIENLNGESICEITLSSDL